jgi:hypothetical protein
MLKRNKNKNRSKEKIRTYLANRPPPAWFNLKALGTTGNAGILKATGFGVAVRDMTLLVW